MRLFSGLRNSRSSAAQERHWRQFPTEYSHQLPTANGSQYTYWYTFPKALSMLSSSNGHDEKRKGKKSKKLNGYEDSSLYTVRLKTPSLTIQQMVRLSHWSATVID